MHYCRNDNLKTYKGLIKPSVSKLNPRFEGKETAPFCPAVAKVKELNV